MKPFMYHKGMIDQPICDIQENEWYCIQGGYESELKDWEKFLIVQGLKMIDSQETLDKSNVLRTNKNKGEMK